MQDESAVSDANWALSFCASSTFCSWNEDEDEVGTSDGVDEAGRVDVELAVVVDGGGVDVGVEVRV